jgi:23S rRNA C2498 (ribose-2'-O)-methylase RlmM
MATNTQVQLQRILDHLENGTTSPEVSAEEKERKRSLLISGIPEFTNAKQLRSKDNLAAITKILDEINAKVTSTIDYRLPTSNRSQNITKQPRLLKVVLAISYQQQQALKKREEKERKRSLVFSSIPESTNAKQSLRSKTTSPPSPKFWMKSMPKLRQQLFTA